MLMKKTSSRAMSGLIACIALSACGDSGKWVEAPDTLSMYAGMDRARQMQEQIEANERPTAESRNCEDLLGQMRDHIKQARAGNIMFQQMVRNCADIGMQYGSEVRCESGRLQVKCK
jgi:hypothetical protein